MLDQCAVLQRRIVMVVRLHRDGPDLGLVPGAELVSRRAWAGPGQLSFLIHISNQTPIHCTQTLTRGPRAQNINTIKTRKISWLYQDYCTVNGIICYNEPLEKSHIDCTIESILVHKSLKHFRSFRSYFGYKSHFWSRRLRVYLALNLPIVPYLCFIWSLFHECGTIPLFINGFVSDNWLTSFSSDTQLYFIPWVTQRFLWPGPLLSATLYCPRLVIISIWETGLAQGNCNLYPWPSLVMSVIWQQTKTWMLKEAKFIVV